MYRMIRAMLVIALLLAAVSVAMLVATAPWSWIVLARILRKMTAKKPRRFTSHGSARWAELDEIPQGDGLAVGMIEEKRRKTIVPLLNPWVDSRTACDGFLQAKRSRLVKLSCVHVSIYAPTGVGKGVSCIIPFLLSCPDSCVVVDFKGENYLLSSNARRALGHKIVVLDPFKVVTQAPDTFNLFDFIDGESPLVLDEVRDLAGALVIRTGEESEPHWSDSAEVWIAAMAATVAVLGSGENRSLQVVRLLLTDPVRMEAAIKLMCESNACEGMLARLGHQLRHYQSKELNSVLTTTNRHLNFLDTIAVSESTKGSSFDPSELVNGKMTVYLVLPPEHMRKQSALLRLWIGSLLRAVVKGGLQEKHKVHFILDEAASLGRMDVLDDAVDKYRGYGVRLQFYYQSVGQLKRCWPEGGDQTLLSNTTQVFFGVNDLDTAKYVSERLGDSTVVSTGGGGNDGSNSSEDNKGSGSRGRSRGSSTSWSQTARKLLTPGEVMALDKRIAISFCPGVLPIASRLTRYYETQQEPRFQTLRACCISAILLLLAVIGAMLAAQGVSGLNGR